MRLKQPSYRALKRRWPFALRLFWLKFHDPDLTKSLYRKRIG